MHNESIVQSSPEWTRVPRPSDYGIRSIEELRPGDRVILVCRVSYCTQDHNGNLADQEENLRREAERRGAFVIDVFPYVASGVAPFLLTLAFCKARRCRAKLLAESVDRYIRHPAYHSQTNPNAQAGEDELLALRYWSHPVPLLTLVPPDASPEEVRSYQRKRGQQMKDRKGGRPATQDDTPGRRKHFKQTWLLRVLELDEQGLSVWSIAEKVSSEAGERISHTAVWKWIKESRSCKLSGEPCIP